MKWTVTWKPSALRQMTALWMKSVRKAAFTQASNETEKLLHDHPRELGESREGFERVYIHPPLCFLYDVIPDDRKVIVISVVELTTRDSS